MSMEWLWFVPLILVAVGIVGLALRDAIRNRDAGAAFFVALIIAVACAIFGAARMPDKTDCPDASVAVRSVNDGIVCIDSAVQVAK